MKNIGKVLSEYRKKAGLSQTQVADSLRSYNINIKNAAVSAWEKNVSIPNAAQFLALCELLSITDIYSNFIGEKTDSLFSGLNQKGLERLKEYASLLLLSEEFKISQAPVIPLSRKIRYALLPASAGPGNWLDDECFEEIEVDSSVPASADFGVRISGDSMEPSFHDGDSAWIEKTDTLNSGETGLFFYDDRTYIKVFKKTKSGPSLVSLNEKYAPINISSNKNFKIFGRVLGTTSGLN